VIVFQWMYEISELHVSNINPKVQLHDIKVVVWYDMNATRKTGPAFHSNTVNSHRYMTQTF
jgi:hypothetical protein